MVEPVTGHRFAIIGCGSIGQRHLRNLKAAGARDIIVVDPLADRRDAIAAELGVASGASLEAAWDFGADVAFVTSPTSLHLEHALSAARHGCHLFVEKPLGDRWEGVGELLEEVRRRKLTTLVGCNLRFHPGLGIVKHTIESGQLGRVTSARVEAGQYLPDWHPSEDYRLSYSARRAMGGGIILDAIHELDYIRWLLGEVATVACFAGHLSHLQIDSEDTAAILLRFAAGAIGEVHLDYVQRSYSRNCHIIGDEGTIRWSFGAKTVDLYTAAEGNWRGIPLPADWTADRMYTLELDHFLRCLDGTARPELDIANAARVLQIALAAKRSSGTNQVIELETTAG
jgi:predicted dehydrogenase